MHRSAFHDRRFVDNAPSSIPHILRANGQCWVKSGEGSKWTAVCGLRPAAYGLRPILTDQDRGSLVPDTLAFILSLNTVVVLLPAAPCFLLHVPQPVNIY